MKEPRQRKDNRRPDLEIYKPGLSRLRNKSKIKEPSGSDEFKEEIVNDRDSSKSALVNFFHTPGLKEDSALQLVP